MQVWTYYPSRLSTRFLALSSSLKANAVEVRICLLIDFILAPSSFFLCNAISFSLIRGDFATSYLSNRPSNASILRTTFLYVLLWTWIIQILKLTGRWIPKREHVYELPTFISSSGSSKGTPSLENLERTSETFFKVFSRASSGKRSLDMITRTLLNL